jgi:hypothetical protein
VLYLHRFQPDPGRTAEFLATLWQGPIPADLRLHRWLYVDGEPRQMVLLWEGEEPARQWVERAFGSFGTLTVETVTDSTPGLAACLDRDLDVFGAWLRARGSGEEEIARQLRSPQGLGGGVARGGDRGGPGVGPGQPVKVRRAVVLGVRTGHRI